MQKLSGRLSDSQLRLSASHLLVGLARHLLQEVGDALALGNVEA